MVIASANNSGYKVYRCPPTGDCTKRVSISADIVEGEIIAEVKRLIEGMEGTATAADGAQEAATALESAQAALDGALTAFSGLDTEPAAIARLKELQGERDTARERYEQLLAVQGASTVSVRAGDWDLLTLEEQRALVKAVIDHATVAPGRGSGRVSITPRA